MIRTWSLSFQTFVNGLLSRRFNPIMCTCQPENYYHCTRLDPFYRMLKSLNAYITFIWVQDMLIDIIHILSIWTIANIKKKRFIHIILDLSIKGSFTYEVEIKSSCTRDVNPWKGYTTFWELKGNKCRSNQRTKNSKSYEYHEEVWPNE